jgi:hypothetical protein
MYLLFIRLNFQQLRIHGVLLSNGLRKMWNTSVMTSFDVLHGKVGKNMKTIRAAGLWEKFERGAS